MVKKADDGDEEVAFPPGIPRPHQVRDWCRYIEKRLTDLELTDVSNEEIPKGKFDLVWSKASLEPPPKLPAKASWADQMRFRSMRDEIEKRRRHNEHVAAQRDEWFSKGNNEYFELITSTMVKTNPGLRQVLRDRYYVGDARPPLTSCGAQVLQDA